VIFNPARSKQTSIAAVLALFAAACGDGTDIRLGSAREGPLLQEGGTGDGGADAGHDDADSTIPDSTSGCPNGSDIPGPMLALLDERVGFGQQATGGKDGCLYTVTDYSDSPEESRPGTLRYGLENPERLWIVFDGPGEPIQLTDNLRPLSNKTIDARETTVRLLNYGIEIVGQQNFIIRNLEFKGNRDLEGTTDAITLRQGTDKVWIDHSTFSDYRDSLIDVIDGATNVTISWSRFHTQDKVMLLGTENDADVGPNMKVTLHHNWFDHTYTWHPRARWGMVHMFNNLVEAWGTYALGPTQNVRVVSEANIYLADPDQLVAIRTADIDDEVASRNIWSQDDSFRGGAEEYVNPDGGSRAAVFEPRDQYPYEASPAKLDDTLLNAVRAGAGAH
jgi:pectate lyase